MTGAGTGPVVTRDEVELEIWRITGARDADRVDALLMVIDGYARAVAGIADMPGGNPPGGGRPMRRDGHVPFSGRENAPGTRRNVLAETMEDNPGMSGEFNRLLADVRADVMAEKSFLLGGDNKEPVVCSKCGNAKQHEEFAHDRTRPNGLRHRCRVCESAARKRLKERGKSVGK